MMDEAQNVRQSRGQLDGTQQGLGGVGQDRRLVVAAGTFLALAQLDTRPDAEATSQPPQGHRAHDG